VAAAVGRVEAVRLEATSSRPCKRVMVVEAVLGAFLRPLAAAAVLVCLA